MLRSIRVWLLPSTVVLATSVFAQPPGPVSWWKFDEGSGALAIDVVSGYKDRVVAPRWIPGVSGTALVFNDQTTAVRRPAAFAPGFSKAFTAEAWIALQAYPWNWCGIVSQVRDQERGYSFGVDALGHVGLQVFAGGEWRRLVSEDVLPLRRWVHVAGVFDAGSGLALYINGQPAGKLPIAGALKPASQVDLLIGRNPEKMAAYGALNPTANLPAIYALDGALDEIRLYDRALGQAELSARHAAMRLKDEPVFKLRRLPSGPPDPGRFGAYYTRLAYDEGRDAMYRSGDFADVLVRFDRLPTRLIFWRGGNMIPFWMTENGIGYIDQFLETFQHGIIGYGEPMSDKQARHSHVRILESHDARCVVHWRYALLDVAYNMARQDPDSGWSDWVDEYFTVYPDGAAVRKMVLWSSQPDERHEFHERVIVNEPGTKPEDNIDASALTLMNMKGETYTYTWPLKRPVRFDKPEAANMHMVNLKSKYRPFLVVPPPATGHSRLSPAGSGPQLAGFRPRQLPVLFAMQSVLLAMQQFVPPMPPGALFRSFNHWPDSHMPTDGRWALTPERPSHFSLAHFEWEPYEQTENSMTKLMFHGLTDKKAEEILPLAKSWLNPPAVHVSGGHARSLGYDQPQRAYVFACETDCSLEFELRATPDSPAINPVFVVNNWGDTGAALTVNGKPAPRGDDFRVGHVRGLAGTNLVVWLNLETTGPLKISLAREKR